MKRIRYLSTLIAALLCAAISQAQTGSGFNPADPPEPGQPPMKLVVTVQPAEAGSVSLQGTGRYVVGTRVSLTAYANTGFRFVSWTNEAGEVLSTQTTYQHVKQERHERLTANYVFDPTAPAEPQDPATIMYSQLQLNATEGGSVSGGGRYLAGRQVTLQASCESKFDFGGWYDDATGELLSTQQRFDYTTTAKHRSITARFVFNPDSPAEPQEPVLRHTLTALATDGGTVSPASTRVLEGTSVRVSASTNSGYDFDGWYLDGELYTQLATFNYTMGKENVTFEARFTFNPDSPAEPQTPTTKQYAFYLMNIIGKPGDVVRFPVYLTNMAPLKDISFQLNFPTALQPNLESVELSAKAEGYEVSASSLGEGSYFVTLVGGSLAATNTPLVTFSVKIPDDFVTGQTHQVTINQVTVVDGDDQSLNASTRNGRISVYKLGDTNGDDVVDILDKVNLVTRILGRDTDVFIEEVSNINGDEELDILDAVGIVEIILGK